jgi:O-antigen/teichoic acid export membrane protein
VLFFQATYLSSLIFGDAAYADFLRVSVVTVPFSLAVAFYKSLFRAQRRPWRFATLTLAQLFLVVGLNLYLVAVLRVGVIGVLLSSLITSVCLSLVGLALIRSELVFVFTSSWLRRLLAYGLPLVPASLAYWVLAYADRYFLLHYVNLGEVGLYAVSNKLSALMALVTSAFQMAWPAFAFSIMKEPDAPVVYARTLTLYAAVMAFLSLGLSVLGREILLIMTTPAYVAAYQVVGILCLGLVAKGSYYIVGVGLGLKKKTGHLAWIAIVAAVLNIGLNFLLIPGFGMRGAALATLFSYAFSTVLLYFVAQRHYPIPFHVGKVGRVFLITLSLMLPALLLDQRVQALSLPILVVKIGFLAAFPLLLVASGVFDQYEVQIGRASLTSFVGYMWKLVHKAR